MPFGPQREPPEMPEPTAGAGATTLLSDVAIDVECSELVRRIGSSLSEVAGHDASQAEAHPGRVEGPVFQWRNASGQPANNALRQ